MKKPVEEKHLKAKLSLIPVLMAVGAVSAFMSAGIALLITSVLINISSMATDARDNTLPVLYSHQRIIISLERLGRFGEIINTTSDKSKRRKAQLAALTLGNDPDFENNPVLYAKVWKMLRIIRTIYKNKNAQDTFRKMTAQKLLEIDAFLQTLINARNTAGKSSHTKDNALNFIIEKLFFIRLKLSETITESSSDRLNVSENQTRLLLADITSKFKESAMLIKMLGPDRLSVVSETSAEIYDLCKSIIEKNDENAVLWDDARSVLDILKNNMSADTVTATADKFSLISEKAGYVMKIGIIGLLGMVFIILALLLFVQHYIIIPIATATRRLETADRHLDVDLPPARIKELDAIYRAVEQLKETSDALWGETQLAKKIQTVLVPREPVMEAYEVSCIMSPTDEVGGDYYDVINTGKRAWLAIGDVSGHGVPAGLIMMMVQSTINTAVAQNPDIQPSDLLSEINTTISKNIRRLGEDKYMTITVLSEHENGLFRFSGLHEDIMIYRKDLKKVELVETNGMWIGVVDDISELLKDDELELNIGDTMLLFTDGITESWKKGHDRKKLFGDERLKDVLCRLGDCPADEIKNGILKELENYDSDDDITMLILKRIT